MHPPIACCCQLTSEHPPIDVFGHDHLPGRVASSLRAVVGKGHEHDGSASSYSRVTIDVEVSHALEGPAVQSQALHQEVNHHFSLGCRGSPLAGEDEMALDLGFDVPVKIFG